MKIQENISVIMNKKLGEYRNQADFARDLGVGRTIFRSCLAGKGNPSADTIELLAKGMNISPAQLVAGGAAPSDSAFDIISGMVDTLHPTLQAEAVNHLEALRQLFQLSEELNAKGARWKYVVAEPRPSCYTLRAMERAGGGWMPTSAESAVFTGDRGVAEAAAELFTRNALSPIHLEEAIEDYVSIL